MNWLCVNNVLFKLLQYLMHFNETQLHYSATCLSPSSKIQSQDYFHFQAGLFPHCVHKNGRHFIWNYAFATADKAFRSSRRCDFTCVIRDAAHLHRNENVRAGPRPHGWDVLTTTGLGWLPKPVPPGRINPLLQTMTCTCLYDSFTSF